MCWLNGNILIRAYQYVPHWGTYPYEHISMFPVGERIRTSISVCSLLGNVSVRAYQYVPHWGTGSYERISTFPIRQHTYTLILLVLENVATGNCLFAIKTDNYPSLPALIFLPQQKESSWHSSNLKWWRIGRRVYLLITDDHKLITELLFHHFKTIFAINLHQINAR